MSLPPLSATWPARGGHDNGTRPATTHSQRRGNAQSSPNVGGSSSSSGLAFSSSLDRVSRPKSRPPAELVECMGVEVAARRRYASASRSLQQAAVSSSASRLQAI